MFSRSLMELATAFPAAPPGGVLVDEDIRRLAKKGMITTFREGSLQPASYDLGLGDLYFADGSYRAFHDPTNQSLTLKFGEFILLTSLECLSLPDDVVAHAGLVSGRAQSGLVSLFSPQIDPGFQGRLVVPLFNAGRGPITLVYGEPIFTVEFVRTTRRASERWSDTHAPLMGIPPSAMQLEGGLGALTEISDLVADLRQRLDAAESDVKHMKESIASQRQESSLKLSKSQVRWAIVAALLTVVVIVVAIVFAS